jgi:hypothetical protein
VPDCQSFNTEQSEAGGIESAGVSFGHFTER